MRQVSKDTKMRYTKIELAQLDTINLPLLQYSPYLERFVFIFALEGSMRGVVFHHISLDTLGTTVFLLI